MAADTLLSESRWPPVVAMLLFFALNVVARIWLPHEGLTRVPVVAIIEGIFLVVLITGNLPFKTEVASLYVAQRINSGDSTGAAALALLMLVVSFGVLLGIGGLRRWATRHDR